jgi:hypothetical protein
VTTVSDGDDSAARRSTYCATFLMLAGTSVTFLEALIPTAMRGIIEDALRRPQASLASEFHGHAARTLRQSPLA